MTGAGIRIFLCVLWLPGVAATTAGAESLRVERLAAGVYAALQPAENSQNDCNSVVLIGDSGSSSSTPRPIGRLCRS